MRYYKATFALPLVALTALGGGIAHAADQPAAAPATGESAATRPDANAVGAPGAPAANPEGGALGAIIVTATKRETNLQQTPIAISVIGDQQLKNDHVESLLDLSDGSVPSLRVATFEDRHSALTVGIRGIVPFDQNQVAREPGVGVYLDGVYLGRSQGLNSQLFDVQRIEVLRGPQGTLFGRNTEGGALSIVTKAPTGIFEGRVSAGIGNYGEYNGEVHVDLPSMANIAVKLDGIIQHQDATTKNPATGQYGWNWYNRVGGRAAARWKPVDGLTIDVAYDQAKDENTPYYSQLINYNPNGLPVGTYVGTTLTCNGAPRSGTNPCIAPLSPLVVVSGDRRMDVADLGVIQQPSVDLTHGVMGTIKYDISRGIELRSITAWRGVETHQWDGSAGAHRSEFVPNGQFGRYSLSELFQHQFSQELQIVGTFPHLDFVLGAYYFKEHVREIAATPNPEQWNATGTGYTFVNEVTPNPTAPITSGNQGWDRRYWYLQRDSFGIGKSEAVFGQFTYTPAGLDIFHLTGGARYTHEERTGALTIINNAPFADATLDYSNSRVDPMVTLALDATPNVHLYAKYSTGFRSGGANSRSSSFRRFDPESVRSYEIGAKTDFLDHRVRLNVAGYIMDRKNTQIDFDFVDTRATLSNGAPNPFYTKHTEETVNAPGTSRIKGVEVDLTVRPVDGLTLGASYAYTDVNVPPVPNPIAESPATYGVITKVFTVYTPKNAYSVFGDYEVPVGLGETTLRLHLDADYADPQYSFQSEDVLSDSSFIVNGSIALADIPVNALGSTATFSLWARNLFNEAHIYRRSNANNAILGAYANFNPPRTFGLQGTINFGGSASLPPPPPAYAPPPPPPVEAAPPPPPVEPAPPPPPPAPQPTGERG